MSRKKQKFDVLSDIYIDLAAEFVKMDVPKLSEMAVCWLKGLSDIQQQRASQKLKASLLVSGLEQGLREIPLLLSILTKEECYLALNTYRRITTLHVPMFFEEEREKIQKILARKKIKNEAEWYLIRHHLDEIERDITQILNVQQLYVLLEEYEAKA